MTGDDPDEMGDKLIKVNLGTGEVAVDMALGEEHTCVILESGGTKVCVRERCGRGGRGGGYEFVACLKSLLTIDHTSLSRLREHRSYS